MPDDTNKNLPTNNGQQTPPASDPLPPVFMNSDEPAPPTPIIPDTKPNKKEKTEKAEGTERSRSGKGKIVAAVLGVLLLVGGLGAGFILVRQNQNVSEKASTSQSDCIAAGYDWCSGANNGNGTCCPEGYTCAGTYCEGGGGGGGEGFACPYGTELIYSNPPVYVPRPNRPTEYCRYSCDEPGPDNNWVGECAVTPQEDCTDKGGRYCQVCSCVPPTSPTPVPSATPAPECNSSCDSDSQCPSNMVCYVPSGEVNGSCRNSQCLAESSCVCPTALCYDIKIFDTDWNQLTLGDLATFRPGDVVRITVAGQASGGNFTMARFTVNGVQRTEVTAKRPGTEEFYDEYTLPEGTATFNVKAQVYHDSLGWK